jgi:hypothetical protein
MKGDLLMYETTRKYQDSTLHNLRQEMGNQQQADSGRVQMPILHRKRKKGGLALIGDYILDKLYQIEEHKDDICFLMLVVVVNYFVWQMIRGLM